MAPKPLTIDMVDRKIGKLTVIMMAKRTGRTPGTHWFCRCECGRDRVVVGSWLRRAEKLGHVITCDFCRGRSPGSGSVREEVLEEEEEKPKRGRGRRCKESKWCQLCAGLKHRVEGERCVECGLLHADEEAVRVEDLPQHSYRD